MKYLFYRNVNPQGYGLKRKEDRFVMVYNTETNRWFAVSPGESVKKKDKEKNHHYDFDYELRIKRFDLKDIAFQYYIEEGEWVKYSRRPRQIKP